MYQCVCKKNRITLYRVKEIHFFIFKEIKENLSLLIDNNY